MKKLIFTALLLSSSTSLAFTCRDDNGGPDHGTNAIFSEDMKSATIEEMTIAGPRAVATLNCKKYPRTSKMIKCTSPKNDEKKFILTINNTQKGKSKATFSEVTKSGNNQLTTMTCASETEKGLQE
jgi:hypothetical protein